MAVELTGKALFELHREIEPYDLAWSEIGEWGQRFYSTVAEQLNARYLAPLQGELERQVANTRDAYEEVARLQRENDAYKALLLRHKGFIEQTPFMTQEEWLTTTLVLFSDTVTLLNGEQKEK